MDFEHTNVSCSNNTLCSNVENTTDDLSRQNDTSDSWQEVFPQVVFQGLILSLETIVGLLGNGILVYLILTCRSLRNICNYYILNRAIADILFQLPNLLVIITIFKRKFIFGYGGCLFFSLTCQISFLISLVAFILMCVDCYKSTPHGYHSPTYRANLLKRGMCTLWIIGIALTLPLTYLTLYFEKKEEDGDSLKWAMCIPSPVLYAYQDTQFDGNVLFYLAIPLIVIWVYIWKSFRRKLGDVPYVNSLNEGDQAEVSATGDAATAKPEVDAVFSKQFITALATLFTILDLVYWLTTMTHVPKFGVLYVPFLFEGSITLLDLHVALKPIICIMFANDLHQEFVKLLPTHKLAGDTLQEI